MPASPAGACCRSFEQPAPGDLDTRWAKAGVWERVFKHLAKDADNEYAMIDSTIVRAHQHSAGAQKKSARTKRSVAAKAD